MMERILRKREGYLRVEKDSFIIDTFFNKLIRLCTGSRPTLEEELFKRVKCAIEEEWDWDRLDWDYKFEKGRWFFGKYYGDIRVKIYEYRPTPELLKKRQERMDKLNSLTFPQLVDEVIAPLPKRMKGEKVEIVDDPSKHITYAYSNDVKTTKDPDLEIEFQNFMAKYNADMLRPKEKILPSCPNCGANAWVNGSCSYCGTKILI